jgi:hypothetical protein
MSVLTDCNLKDSILDDSEGPSAVVDLLCVRVLNIMVSSGVWCTDCCSATGSHPNHTPLNLTCKENQSIQIDFSNFLSVSILFTKFLLSLVIQSLSLRVSNHWHGLKFYLWTTALIQDCFPFSQISQFQIQLVIT